MSVVIENDRLCHCPLYVVLGAPSIMAYVCVVCNSGADWRHRCSYYS